MLKRSDSDSILDLKSALRSGVEAMNNPEIEAKVETYFRENPSYSRDMVHVAAIAIRFQREKTDFAGRKPKYSVRV